MAVRDQLSPHFFVYPTQYRVPQPLILYWQEEGMGFEAAGLPGWSLNQGGLGTITQVTSPVKYGTYALRTRAPGLADFAWARKASALAASGILVFEAYVYIADYFGTTDNDYQFCGVYNDLVARYVFTCIMRATGYLFQHEGEANSPVQTALSKSIWHRILIEHNYTTKLGRFFMDDTLIWQHTSVNNDAPKYIYLGDTSGAIMRGDFYWDHVGVGRKV